MTVDRPASWLTAVTVLQPYASAILLPRGGKTVENRASNTAHRGPLVIHAGVRPHPAGASDMRVRRLRLQHPRLQHPPTGALLGVVDLVDIDHCTGRCSVWAMRGGYFHWHLARPRPLKVPIPWRGQLGLWRLHDGRDDVAVLPLRQLLEN